ncbi:MAG: ABC transporter permease subunit [Planctomycetes bacterium]|nr:ABC transporter permease subunit [Planctomycetota bacterium]
MLTHVIRRVLAAVPMLAAISVAAFLLLHALPGDPAAYLLGQRATEENKRQFRERAGLDLPLEQQYVRWAGGISRGDFGESHRTNKPVIEELGKVIPATVELAVVAMLFATLIGVSLGMLAAIKPRSIADFTCLGFALIGVSVPIFWLGFMAQKLFAGELKLLPFGRRLGDYWEGFQSETGFHTLDAIFVYQSPELLADVLHHLLLPGLVLSTVPMALIARITRASMLEALRQDYVRTARAKGVKPMGVVMRHALRNATIPIVTAVATQFGYLLGGAVLTETIFSWPGLGRYTIEAIEALDARPLQAGVLVVATTFVLVNLLTDLSYAFIDPRLRKGEGREEVASREPWRARLWQIGVLVFVGVVLSLAADRVLGRNPARAQAIDAAAVVALGLLGAWLLFYAVKNLLGGAAVGFGRRLALILKAALAGVGALLKYVASHRPALIGLGIIIIVAAAAVLAPIVAPYGPMQAFQDLMHAPSSSAHWLGTDSQGRDLYTRLLYGARTTLLVALAATTLSMFAGSVIGAVAGYFGRWTDLVLMRGVDFMMSFPSFLLAVVTVAVLGKSLDNLIWAVGIAGAPSFARQVRAEVLRLKSQEFVEAAGALGYGHSRILLRHLVPNCLTPMIVLATLGMGGSILSVAGLAFLGLGGDPFVPEWGLILKLGWDESSKGAFQVGVAGACIMVTVLGFNLIGDGLRDWLDPRSRGK